MYVYFANGMPGLSTNVSMDSDMCFTSFADMFSCFFDHVCVCFHVVGVFFSLPGHAMKSLFPQ